MPAVLHASLRAAQASEAAAPHSDFARGCCTTSRSNQIELEMQNRELRGGPPAASRSRARAPRRLYDFAPVVYVTLDARAGIVEANLTAASYFGVERGNLVGKSLSVFALVVRRRGACASTCSAASRQAHSGVDSESVVSRARRPTVTAQVISVRCSTRDGAVIGCKTTLTDITELKRAQEKLQFLSQAARSWRRPSITERTSPRCARGGVPVMGDSRGSTWSNDGGHLSRLAMAFADPSERDPAGLVAEHLAACRRGDSAGSGDTHAAAAAVPRLFGRHRSPRPPRVRA
jgi:PAS domain S-box-containing protein